MQLGSWKLQKHSAFKTFLSLGCLVLNWHLTSSETVRKLSPLGGKNVAKASVKAYKMPQGKDKKVQHLRLSQTDSAAEDAAGWRETQIAYSPMSFGKIAKCRMSTLLKSLFEQSSSTTWNLLGGLIIIFVKAAFKNANMPPKFQCSLNWFINVRLC